MASTVNLQALGLNYSPNNLSLPQGSLVQADNVIIRRDNTLESRRGIREYAENFGSSTDRVKQLIEYKDRIIAHYDSKLSFDTGTIIDGKAIFEDFYGSYSETKPGLRIKSIEANKNLYFTTEEGIKKISAKTADDLTSSANFITNAGAVKASDITADLNIEQGQLSGFLPPDSTVAYRAVWGYKDKNENLLLGTPSNRAVVYNYLSDNLSMDLNALCANLDILGQSVSISSVSIANPTIITCAVAHGLTTGDIVNIAGTNTTGSTVGSFVVTVPSGSSTTFTIPVNVTSVTTGTGSFTKSLITDKNYASSFYSPTNTDTSTLKANVSTLATKLDTDILLGKSLSSYPLQINSFSLDSSNTVTVNFSNGDPNNYTSINDYIEFTGLDSPNTLTISSITAGSPTIITTSAAHNLTTDNSIVISGTNTFLDNTWKITKIDGTNFSIEKNSKFNITNIVAGSTSTITEITTDVVHGLSSGNTVNIAGCTTSPTINGTHSNIIVTSPTTFTIVSTFVSATTLGTVSPIVTSGSIKPIASLKNLNGKQQINGINYKKLTTSSIVPGTTTVITTTTDHGLNSGDFITISGTGSNLDSTWKISSIGPALNVFSILTGTTSIISPSTGTVLKSNITFVYSPSATETVVPFENVSQANAVLNSYNYRNIVETGDSIYATSLSDTSISIPATSEQTRIVNNTLYRISERLKSEKIGIIQNSLKINYISTFSMTQYANAKITITIPKEIAAGSDYFVQVYRTRTFTANGDETLGESGGNPIIADDEMRLVYEQFPTNSEIAVNSMYFIDQSPQSLVANNTNLYTNPETGEGILNANEPPPFATDINRFKNVVFYSNTRTKHKLTQFQLLGVEAINNLDKITIASELGSSTYTFVNGAKEKTLFDFNASTTYSQLQNTYFNINAANDNKQYFLWYRVDNKNISSIVVDPIDSTKTRVTTIGNHNIDDGAKTTISNVINSGSDLKINGTHTITKINNTVFTINVDISAFVLSLDLTNATAAPYFDNKILKIVDIFSSDTLQEIVNKTANVLNILVYDFSVTTGTTSFTVTNLQEGITTSADIGKVPTLTLTITVQQEGNGESASDYQILRSSLTSAAQAIQQTAESLVRIVNKKDLIINAFYTSTDTTPPGQITFEAKTLSPLPFYVIGSNSSIGSAFNPDIGPISQINDTNIKSITIGNPALITTANNHGLNNGDSIIISNMDNGTTITNIDGYQIVTVISPTTFTIPANASATVTGLNGVWSKTVDTIVSDNEIKPNRVYYSKIAQPEAVPLLNYFDISAEDKQILRIYPLRNTLFAFKEDGTYRISGEVAPFTVSLLDSSCVVIAPDSVSATNNIVYAWTSKGITPVSEMGASQEVSRPIDTEILRLSSAKFENFKTLTWGVGYDSDSSYTVYTNSSVDDTSATVGFRYCTLTNTWTNITRSQTCGIINQEEDKMYLGSGLSNIINKERKNFDRTDYSDEDFEILLAGNSVFKNGAVLSFSSVNNINVGDVIVQNQALNIFKFNNLLKQIDTDPAIVSVNHNNYYDTLFAIPGDDMRNKIVALALKLDSDSVVVYNDYFQRINNKSGNISNNIATNPTTINTSSNHGLINGRVITIPTNNGSIPSISGNHVVSNTGTYGSSTSFSIPVNVITAGTSSTFTTSPNTSFEDIKACFNDIVTRLNSDSGLDYSSYEGVTDETPVEAIVTAVNKKSKQITVNLALDWIVGPITVYKAIACSFKYAPITMDDPLSTKQIFDTTIMFKDRAITEFTVSFSSDLKPEFLDVTLRGDGNGIFGYYSNPGFGYGFFGGGSNNAPFRTTIPLQVQRCRYLNYKITHNIARESWSLFGISLTGNVGISFRGYR